ncbi:unnamed protein product [Bathycoccus prasinos]
MHRSRVVKAFERTRKRAAEVVSTSTRRSRTSFRFWSRFSNAFSSSFFLREQERDELSRTTTNGKERTSGETDTERSLRRRKEEPQNKFLESLRRETVENLDKEQHVSNAKEEEDFKPPTRAFRDLREKTFRETRGEELNSPLPKEINGPRGLEPTRFKDWEVGGRCTDF